MPTYDLINTALLLVVTLVLGRYLKDRFAAQDKRADRQDEKIDAIAADVAVLKTDVSGVKSDVAVLKTDMSGVKADLSAVKNDIAGLHGRIDELSREVGGMRSDMVQIALAVGVRTRPETA